jgi:hypothetical protein
MRIRTVLCATALATVAAFPLAGVASAQQPTDRDCRDFASQAAAQSALRSHSGDPERLDSNHNGIACEEYFKTAQPAPPEDNRSQGPDGEPRPAPPAQPVVDRDPRPGVVAAPPGAPERAPVKTVPEHQILVKPHGAPDTGDGSAAPSDPMPAVLLAGAIGVVGVIGAVGVVGALGARRRAARR